MSESLYRGQIERLLRDKSRLEGRQADELRKALKLEDDARRIEGGVTRYTSASSADGKLRQANRKRQQAADLRGKAAKIGDDIARKETSITSAQKSLARAVEQRQRKEDAAEKKRRDEERRHIRDVDRERRRAEREEARRRRIELAHERELTREATRRTGLYPKTVPVAALRRLPERIVILFATADARDQARLALDEEVRDVSQRLRAAKHRDAVELKPILALRPKDLIPALNEHEPRIVHFSGHGSDAQELVFLDESGNAKPVSGDALAATLATVSDHVKLVVLNACYTSDQASQVVEHIPAAVGMTSAIGDHAARSFSTAFYGAIADGCSVERAFQQGLAQLMLEGIAEEDTPELFTAEGVDADELVLVRPPEQALGGQLAA